MSLDRLRIYVHPPFRTDFPAMQKWCCKIGDPATVVFEWVRFGLRRAAAQNKTLERLSLWGTRQKTIRTKASRVDLAEQGIGSAFRHFGISAGPKEQLPLQKALEVRRCIAIRSIQQHICARLRGVDPEPGRFPARYQLITSWFGGETGW